MTSRSYRHHQKTNQSRHQINKKQRHLRYEPYEMTHHSPNRSFENTHHRHDVMSYESLRHRDYMTSPNMSLSSHNYESHRFDHHQPKRTHRHNFNSNNQGYRNRGQTSGFERNSYVPFSKVRIKPACDLYCALLVFY